MHLNRFFAFINDIKLVNLYGPTEAAVQVCSSSMIPEKKLRRVTIGSPIWNTKVYILDENLQPCPVGVEGELYLSGVYDF